jgi:hypothetical protein
MYEKSKMNSTENFKNGEQMRVKKEQFRWGESDENTLRGYI